MSRHEDDWTEVEVSCIHETLAALLIDTGGMEKVWVPKSVIAEHSEVSEPGQSGTLTVKTWFAEKEGLG